MLNSVCFELPLKLEAVLNQILNPEPGMVAHTGNSRTWEATAGQSQTGLHLGLKKQKASLGCRENGGKVCDSTAWK